MSQDADTLPFLDNSPEPPPRDLKRIVAHRHCALAILQLHLARAPCGCPGAYTRNARHQDRRSFATHLSHAHADVDINTVIRRSFTSLLNAHARHHCLRNCADWCNVRGGCSQDARHPSVDRNEPCHLQLHDTAVTSAFSLPLSFPCAFTFPQAR